MKVVLVGASGKIGREIDRILSGEDEVIRVGALALARANDPARAGAEARLADSHAFRLDELRLTGERELDTAGAFAIYAVLSGTGSLRVPGDPFAPRNLSPGDVWLVPASVGYHSALPDEETELRLVRATPPAPL